MKLCRNLKSNSHILEWIRRPMILLFCVIKNGSCQPTTLSTLPLCLIVSAVIAINLSKCEFGQETVMSLGKALGGGQTSANFLTMTLLLKNRLLH